jgi:hypothetical protein
VTYEKWMLAANIWRHGKKSSNRKTHKTVNCSVGKKGNISTNWYTIVTKATITLPNSEKKVTLLTKRIISFDNWNGTKRGKYNLQSIETCLFIEGSGSIPEKTYDFEKRGNASSSAI